MRKRLIDGGAGSGIGLAGRFSRQHISRCSKLLPYDHWRTHKARIESRLLMSGARTTLLARVTPSELAGKTVRIPLALGLSSGFVIEPSDFMSTTYLWVFIALLAVAVTWMLIRPEKAYEFPFFMAATFTIFILPQAFSLIRFPGAVLPESVDAVLLMSCLCLVACVAGYQLAPHRAIIERTSRPVNADRLFHAGLLFIAVGLYFHWWLTRSEIEFAETGGMTGRGTILLFFQNLVYLGLAISLLDAVRRPRCLNLAVTAVGLIIPLQTAIAGRREPVVLVGAIIMLGLYFGRRIKPPRLLIPIAMVAAMLAIPATGTYRSLHADRDWEGIRQINLVENFKKFLTEESVLELRNAAAVIEATRKESDYQLGSFYWDHLVFRFVPAQILGSNFKRSLTIRPEGRLQETPMTKTGFELSIGSTITGMADTFQQFGWFGCLFFALMAILFRSLWEASQGPGALLAQLLYITTCTTAMRAVTHWTADFLPGLIYIVVFLGMAFLYAREHQHPGLARLARGRHREQSKPPHTLPAETEAQ